MRQLASLGDSKPSLTSQSSPPGRGTFMRPSTRTSDQKSQPPNPITATQSSAAQTFDAAIRKSAKTTIVIASSDWKPSTAQ